MSIDKQVFRTWKRNGKYYVAYKRGKNPGWIATGLSNLGQVIKQYSVGIPKSTDTNKTTLSELIRIFDERVRGQIRANTQRGYDGALKQFLEIVGDKRITEISVSDIELFKSKRLRDEASAVTVNIGLRYVRSLLNRAKKWGYLSEVPSIDMLKAKRLPPRFMLQDEFYDIVTPVKDERLRDIFKFAYFTGCRLSEIVNLPWKYVDIERNQFKIDNWEKFETKSGRGRIIPIHEAVKKVLKRRDEQRNGEYVFHKGDGHPWASFYISNQFKEAVRARAKKITLETGSPCSLEDLHFHTLRHSFASVLVSNGIPLIKICQLLGHSSVVVTEIYAHLAPSSLQDTMSAFAHRGTAPPNQIERFIRKVDKLEVAEEE